MRSRPPLNDGAYHFITLPNTGIQICRGFPLPDLEKLGLTAEELWQLAARRAEEWGRREIVRLVAAHIACNPKLESPGWIACDPNEMAFFRLTRTRSGMPISADLVIDTHSGAGRQTKNRIDCLLEKSTLFSRLFPRQYHLASFYVEDHVEAQAVEGSLIMDFGNSGCSFIFSETGSGVLGSPVVLVHNPFDAEYSNPRRTPDQQAIFKSSLVVLRASENPRVDPWLVMGARSEELIRQQPLATYLFAPKKYVRDWPEHVKAKAPSTLYRGVLGQRPGLH